MQRAAISANIDAVGNAIRRYEGHTPGLLALIVRNTGQYDGCLGVIAAIQTIAALHQGQSAPAIRHPVLRLR
jgi:allantoate deiminase